MDAEHNSQNHRRILLLEPDENLASMLDMLLHREGFEIHTATSDDNAIKFLHTSTPPDLIFIDCSWISADRIKVLSDLTQRIEWQRVPMILLMSYYDANKLEQAMSLGITDHILQPFEPGELLDIIQRYI